MSKKIATTASMMFCALCAFSGPAKGAECRELLPTNAVDSRSGVTPEQLLELRDIGQAYGGDPRRHLFTFSPDQQSISFQIHRADPSTNSYCVGLVVLPTRKGGRPRLIDISHDLIMDRPAWYGWSAFPIGTPATITPRWLPGGKQIAYLKRADGLTQVWLANVDGSGARQFSQSATDVDDFRLAADGRSIVYETRPEIPELERQIEVEGLTGWHYDHRAFPVRGPRPQVPAASTKFMLIDIESGRERAATEVEAHELASSGESAPRAVNGDGQEAWSEPENTAIYPPDYRLLVSRGQARLSCPSTSCKLDRSSNVWWSGDGRNVIFSRREGWANSLTGIYIWSPDEALPKRVLVTSDALIECQPMGMGLLCLREGSLEPRHFVKFDLQNGASEKLFDPNPEIGKSALGRVERLHWRNARGVPWYGDLVYPVGYQRGHQYPMVVVQYRTKGFLRGGTGDEVPIQTLADRGFFVLSVDNLTYEDIVGRQKNAEERTAAFNHDFAGRRHILSAIETAIEILAGRNLVAKDKIGITGLSDGCTTAKFAAINSDRFAAGSLSGCGLEPDQDAVLGPAIARTYHDSGWPRLSDKAADFWSKIAFVPEPQRVSFPILFQAVDNEYLATVSSYTALRQSGIPTDLFIFPNENHIKSQPAHRLAVYRRNLDWFGFWLKDEIPSDPTRKAEVERWQEMREGWLNRGSTKDGQASDKEGEDQ